MSVWLFTGLAVLTAGVLAALQVLRIRPREVRVVNFPANEVNESLGTVQGYDAASQRRASLPAPRAGRGSERRGECCMRRSSVQYM